MSEPLLAGRYALGAVVGSGGSADVFAATDVHLGRAVAVKVVRVPGPDRRPPRSWCTRTSSACSTSAPTPPAGRTSCSTWWSVARSRS